MSSPHIVLASTSPLRLRILRAAGIEPLTVTPNVNEDSFIAAPPDATSARIVEQLAQTKVHAVAPEYPNGVVIGGDSVLLLDGHLQGGPRTEGRTIERWYRQSGQTAELVIGHYVIIPKGEHIEIAITSLDFTGVPEENIHAYAATGGPLGYTGAFTLEALNG